MHRPPALHRLLHAVPAALATLAACASTGPGVLDCPGTAVAQLTLKATRRSAACQGDSAPADGSAACLAATPSVVTDCQAARPVPDCCFDQLYPRTFGVQATIALDPGAAAAALCTGRPGALPFSGTWTTAAGGQQVSVKLDTSGAVLASCASHCTATIRQVVDGLLALDPSTGRPTGFTGSLVETDTPTADASCAPCAAPCGATWDLTSTP